MFQIELDVDLVEEVLAEQDCSLSSPRSCSPATSIRQPLRDAWPILKSSIRTDSALVSPPMPNIR